MKKLLQMKAMLLLCALIVGSGSVWATVTWEKATSIQVGDVIVIVIEKPSSQKELTSFSSGSTVYGIGSDYTSTPAGTYTFTVEDGKSDGTFAFKHGSNYLSWTSGNSLNVNATLSNNTSWTVSFSGTDATIKNANDETRQIWWNVSNPRFACYTGKTDGNSYYITTI